VARNGIVRLYLSSGEIPKVLELADKWKAEDPENRTWDAYRGIALARLNRIPESVPALQQALDDDMPRKDVHGTLAIIAQMSGDIDNALVHLQSESDWFPDDTGTRMKIASIYMKQSNWEEAASEFGFVSEIRPQDALARRMWAQAIFNTGDYPAARKILEPAVAYAPDDPFVLLMWANILQKLGEEDKAQEVFARATELRTAQVADQRQAVEGDGLPGMNAKADPTEELSNYGIPE
jgi:tetratricopeptide (TPR) repeat protein